MRENVVAYDGEREIPEHEDERALLKLVKHLTQLRMTASLMHITKEI